MKTIKIFLTSLTILFLIIGCSSNNDPITPTGNTDEYFKYTINGGTEQIFDFDVTNTITNPSTSPNILYFEIDASAQVTTTGGTITKRLGAVFSIPDMTTFLNNTSYQWGISDGTNHKFIFTSIDNNLLINNNANITCTITNHAQNVNEYLEFTFSGSYGNGDTITGSCRVQREM